MSDKQKILASIILYQPETERLQDNIAAVLRQVDTLVLIVNGPGCEPIIEQYKNDKAIKFIKNKKNMGIAYALNQALEYGYQHDFEWVLTLDQDSLPPDNLVDNLCKHCSGEVGIIAPCNTDPKKPSEDLKKSGWEYVTRCITSASLTSVQAWKAVGGFTNELFIDYVDFDYCAKLLRGGYKIIKDYDAVLIHQVGHVKIVRLGKREYPIFNHSAMRRYYYTRNVIYFYKTYPDIANVRWEKTDLLKRCVLVEIFEKQKIKKLFAMIKGAIDSKKLIKKLDGRY